MDVKQVLQELIAIPSQGEDVASVYLDTWLSDEHRRNEVRVFVHDQIRKLLKDCPHERDRQRLEPTLQPIEAYVTGLLRQRHDGGATGVAIFSAQRRLFRVVATRVPFAPMRFELARRPLIAPMVQALGSVPTVLFALIDSEGGSVIEVRSGAVDREAHVERPFPGMHSRGGWSQLRYHHHLVALRERNLRAVAEPLARMSDEAPEALLALCGQHTNLTALEALLPPRTRARIAARVPTPVSSSDGELRDEVLRVVQPQVDEAARARLSGRLQEALSAAAIGGLGVSSVDGTLLALADGSARRIFVQGDSGEAGVRCISCGNLSESSARCRRCGGEVEKAHLLEEIVRRAVLADAEVFFLPAGVGAPGLKLAAQLRHRPAAAQAGQEL